MRRTLRDRKIRRKISQGHQADQKVQVPQIRIRRRTLRPNLRLPSRLFFSQPKCQGPRSWRVPWRIRSRPERKGRSGRLLQSRALGTCFSSCLPTIHQRSLAIGSCIQASSSLFLFLPTYRLSPGDFIVVLASVRPTCACYSGGETFQPAPA